MTIIIGNILFIEDAEGRQVPYRVREMEFRRFDLVNLWNKERYAVDCRQRTCTCGNYEFVQSDSGSYCKHLRALSSYGK